MSDWNNDYTYAGKGAKARKRLRIEDVPKAVNVKPARKKDTRKRYEQAPLMANRRADKIRASEAYHSAIGLKARVRLLVIDHDISFLELMETLKHDGVPLTGVTAGNLRSEMRDIMKLLEKEKLLDVEALARRRKRLKKGV